MGERRLFDLMTDRLTFGRRMRILRHRTARWFQPPVRHAAMDLDGLPPLPRLRLVPGGPAARRSIRSTS